MVAIVDYGIGNLFSLCCSLRAVGEEPVIVSDEKGIKLADKLLLPGVGAFGDAADKLFSSGLAGTVVEEAANGKPLLGICLGMQLLFETSSEYGSHKGLGLIPGSIVPITDSIEEGMRVPHIGWNALDIKKPESAIYKYVSSGDHVYFVHSYHAVGCGDCITATTDYGGTVTASAGNGSVFGCQYHPEKSGETGLKILKAFCETEVRQWSFTRR